MRTHSNFFRLSALALGLIASTHISSGQSWLLTGNALTGTEVLGSTNLFDLRIIANNSERMRVATNGNVGIGLTAPTSVLHVSGGTVDFTPGVPGTQIATGVIELTQSGTPGYPYIDFNDGTLNQDYDSRILYTSSGTLDRLQVQGSEFSVAGSAFIGSAYAATGPASASNSLFVENQLGVGYLTNPGAYSLYVNGTAWANGGWFGSDARWKENVTPIEGALAKVLRLDGVTYDFRHSEYPEMRFPGGTQIGFIAQAVEQVVPELVVTNSDGYKGIAYQNMTPLLVEAIKEQQREIERLRAIVERLDSSTGNAPVNEKSKTVIEQPSLGVNSASPSGTELNAH